MRRLPKTILIILALCPAFLPAIAESAGEEAAIQVAIAPDALFLIDLSGSMAWNPAGGNDKWGDASCAGPFNSDQGGIYTTDCSKLAIAKRAIFNILNDKNSGTSLNVINSEDDSSLNVRMGYMRFYGCGGGNEETEIEWVCRHHNCNWQNKDPLIKHDSGCNQLINQISTNGTATPYSTIYCGSASCTSDAACGSDNTSCVSGATAGGGTPLAIAMNELKSYYDSRKNATVDTDYLCRKRYAIIITDGADTYRCNGDGGNDTYKGRRAVVAAAKALKDSGVNVFVIGMGSAMTEYLKNTLNWMAYYGGTDNSKEDNAGLTTGYSSVAENDVCTDSATYASTADCKDNRSIPALTGLSSCAQANDPGRAYLRGYAFISANATEMNSALKSAIDYIRSANNTFTVSTVQAAQTPDERFIYQASFEAFNQEPFWRGHLYKYQIKNDDDRTVGTLIWDAGEKLRDRTVARNIKTYLDGGLWKDFNTTNITPGILNISGTSDIEKNLKRDKTVGYVRGEMIGTATYNPELNDGKIWKLGDVFRSAPVSIASPNAYFDDLRDKNNAFKSHRNDHERSTANGKRLIVAGTNNGQLQAFISHGAFSSDGATYIPASDDGQEAWSFIPPNLLAKLQKVTHDAHPAPSSQTHEYFVDGPITVADAWWSNSGDGTEKVSSDWKTLLVFGEGRGAIDYLWSSNAYCASGNDSGSMVSGLYSSSTYKHYCGYHALNVTDSLSPSYLWHLNFTDTDRPNQAPYLGEPWSQMMIGRVIVNVAGDKQEKWVGFIGGGFCTSNCNTQGKGFFVVDLSNGKIIWSYTKGDTDTKTTSTKMDYTLPATPLLVDTDFDGFVDRVYIGDTGGNMWRFNFCRSSDMPNCGISLSATGTTSWTGGKFFDATYGTGNNRPVYTKPVATVDPGYQYIWVYWGTGDKTNVTSKEGTEFFYGARDNISSTDMEIDASKITNINGVTPYDDKKFGWRLPLPLDSGDPGEKVLFSPVLSTGMVKFVTYIPDKLDAPCSKPGTSKLYGVSYLTGVGKLTAANTSTAVLHIDLGTGMAPGVTDTVSKDGRTVSYLPKVPPETPIDPTMMASPTKLMRWRDRRIQ